MSRTTAPLTEPTSETIAPRLRWGAISSATAPQAPTGMHRMTRSVLSTAFALLSTTESAMPSSLTRARVLAERAVVTISSANPCSRAARAIEPPISPKPISATLLNGGAAFTGAPRSRASPRPRGDWPLRCRWSCAVRARSEEHTSELQSQSNLVCRLLLEKKNNTMQEPVPAYILLEEGRQVRVSENFQQLQMYFCSPEYLLVGYVARA